MDAQLKERAQQVAALRNSNQRLTAAQIQEIGAVHYALSGRKTPCTSCNVYGLINEVTQFLVKEPLKITDMAKLHFKPEHEKVQVIRHTKNGTVVITSENLNEGDNVKWLNENNYSHLLAESKATAEASEEKSTAKSTSTKK